MTGQDSLAPNKFIIQQLSLRLSNDAAILHDISLEIPAGSITAVIGPSGSGKSSLLRCLNRLWEPPPGSIFIDGRDITAMDVLLLRRRVGMLFQAPLLLLLFILFGLVSVETLSRLRPWIILGIALIAALLTPPDVVSQILLGVPLYLLFELVLVLGRFLKR